MSIKISNEQLLKEYFAENATRYKLDTLDTYDLALRYFFEFCTKPIIEVNRKDISGWMTFLRDKGLCAATIRVKLAALRSFLTFCCEEEYLKYNPICGIRPPKIRETLPHPLTKKELFLIREASKSNLRDRTIIETAYATGVRVSELKNILLADIRWDDKQIWIRDGKHSKERFVLFSAECNAWLQEYLATRKPGDSPYLLINRSKNDFTRQGLELIVKKYVKAANLNPRISMHSFRHTFATHLIARGAKVDDVQKLMGHVNLQTTLVYVQVCKEIMKSKYDEYI